MPPRFKSSTAIAHIGCHAGSIPGDRIPEKEFAIADGLVFGKSYCQKW
jgi:hypothetical protein